MIPIALKFMTFLACLTSTEVDFPPMRNGNS
jgi:hypothetical protein